MTTESTASAKRAVVIFNKPASPHDVARILADVIGTSLTDALIHARYAPGVLPDRLDGPLAENLVGRLLAIGLSAETVDPAALLNFHAAQTIHHARLLEDGFQVVDLEGQPVETITWDRISLISAGQVPLETGQHFNSEHLVASARRSLHDAHRGTLPPVMELWLVIAPGDALIRIDQTRMNYETLGDAKTDSSTENFRNFLKRLAERATAARLSPATNAFLDLDSMLKYTFASTDELQRETQLQTLLAQRG